MKANLRIPKKLVEAMLMDLQRPHPFAYERVGFLYCKESRLKDSGRLLLAFKYEPIEDTQYVEDRSVGARFDSSSVRAAMQNVLSEGTSALHVHLHDHSGRPRFSRVDSEHMQALMPCFVNVCPDRCHGALVLSLDSMTGRVWSIDDPLGVPFARISVVGERMQLFGNHNG